MYYEELAHVIMEADSSQDLQAASWRPRWAGSVVPDWRPADSRPRMSRCVSPSLKAGRKEVSQVKGGGVPSHSEEAQPFCAIHAFNWLDEAHHTKRAICFILSPDLNANLIAKHPPIHTHRLIFDQIAGNPMAQSSWHVKSIVTMSKNVPKVKKE